MAKKPAGVLAEPVAVVWNGASRVVLQPWIDRLEAGQTSAPCPKPDARPLDPVGERTRGLLTNVGALLVTGLRRADADTLRSWQELAPRAEQPGLTRLGAVVRKVAVAVAEKTASTKWPSGPTARALLEAAVLARAAQEVAG